MKRVQKIFTLSPSQWYLIISAIILLPCIKLALNFSGFNKTYNSILGSPLNTQAQTRLNNSQLSQTQTIVRMIDIAATHGFYRANCLTKSLLLMHLLQKRNIACKLMIGTNVQGILDINHFEAHAWVESGGHVLNDQRDISTRYKTFPLPTSIKK